MSTQDLVAKLWNLCNLLRDDGVSYHEYMNELTFLVFLKMAQETETEVDTKSGTVNIPEGYRWSDLKAVDEEIKLEEYKKLLIHLGSHGSLIAQRIYSNANTIIRNTATLHSLVDQIDKLDWYQVKNEGLGDMYEGLLEINAQEVKSGAGQYFTPRVLINAMVELMKPTLKDVIVDPAAGTGGFLVSANHYMYPDKKKIKELSSKDYKKYQSGTYFGMEFVPMTRRLAMMNMMLHDIAVNDDKSGVLFGDTLSNEGKDLPDATLILANPPFGNKMGGGVPTRDDLEHYTGNKQLAFLHLMYHKILKPGGRAAVILPDNALFESGIGKTIRSDLMDKCNLHTILRLPTGIFYAAGVKTNILFFSKPSDVKKDKGQTKNVWVYDLRANMPKFGKRTTLIPSHFDEFYKAVGSDLTQVDEVARHAFIEKHKGGSEIGNADTCRLRCFSREEIAKKDDSLNLEWIRDQNSEDSVNLPEPDVLINEAIEEMAGAMQELQAILIELGSIEESDEVAL
ncbi:MULTISPECIES: class I SAM-dependent DNA methyltransferase [Vibrio]|uniref:class I SAM-dependent DNA methyltransferase n=1 Tax=Vibrio TaxID=662 RepID=UPI0001B945E1|nr:MULTISPECIES: N-6 DNA methylase [Vibrio]EEX34086.1 type I restriction-modification system DNA-methyltransferase subunit M [Vibrio coralliilyticus ATCC BAA-450]MDE3899893.1 N-6 DNA methylase [Vibrio sp. CC007]